MDVDTYKKKHGLRSELKLEDTTFFKEECATKTFPEDKKGVQIRAYKMHQATLYKLW